MSNKLAAILSAADTPSDLIELGKIATAHGVRGWLKINTYSAVSETMLSAKIWWLKLKETNIETSNNKKSGLNQKSTSFYSIKIQSCNSSSENQILAKFENLDDRNLAMSLRGATIWLPRSDFPAPDEDEFYWVDLIGCKFFALEQNQPTLLGRVENVIENGAHAVLEIALGKFDEIGNFSAQLDKKNKQKYTMVPFVKAHIIAVDLANKTIHSNWPAEF